jgi:hypothetical protein
VPAFFRNSNDVGMRFFMELANKGNAGDNSKNLFVDSGSENEGLAIAIH